MRPLAIGSVLLSTLVVAACERTVKVAWDRPAVTPDHYRLLVDGRHIKSFAPPPLDNSCNCMVVEVVVDRGSHALRVEACDGGNLCSSSAEVLTH